MPIQATFGGPFNNQVEFFLDKLNLPTSRWDDVRQAAHDRAFVVAGASSADLVEDLRSAVQKAIAQGRSLEEFRKDFNAAVLKNGWTGWTGEGSAAGQAWRTKIIYTTNMATSYAAGRWKQMKSPEMLATRPYWKYVHSDSVEHPRPLHLSWDGIVLPHDHPFWDTHFCPNGWGCECRVVAVGIKEFEKAQAEGRAAPPPGWDDIDPKTGAPPGIDQGWDYAPGANTERPLKDLIDKKLINLSSPVGAKMYQVVAPIVQRERQAAFKAFVDEVIADPVKRGRTATVGAIDPATLSWLKRTHGIEPAGAEMTIEDGLLIGKKSVRHQLAGDALTADEWSSLPGALNNPEQILYDTRTGKLVYVLAADDGRQQKLAVEFEYVMKRAKGVTNMIVSGFKVPAVAIEAEIKGGFFVAVM
jgi:hypothetical protein